MDQFGQAAPERLLSGTAGGFDDADPELARAIEASYAAQTGAGMAADEDDLLAEAIRLSAIEEEARKRRELGLPEEDEPMRQPDGDAASAAARAGAEAFSDRWPAGSELGGADSMEVDAAIAASVRPHEQSQSVDLMQDDMAAIAASGVFDAPMPGPAHHSSHAHHGGMAGAHDEMLAPANLDASAMEAAAVAEQADETDRQLAMAIEASYAAQTEHGQAQNEDDLMAQALRMSQQEEEARQRSDLRNSQEMELKESELMDQMREEEQTRRRVEEQQLHKMEADRLTAESQKTEADERQKKEQEETKKARIPPEPPAGEAGRADCMFRLPDGKRLRRAFRGTDTVAQVYDYVDVEAAEAVASIPQYRLVSNMPRQIYDDRGLTLTDAGLKGQCALILEVVQPA